jgi:hypothetical protein
MPPQERVPVHVPRDVRPWALAVLACACVVLAIAPFPVGVYQDDGIYAILGKSLATGEGYRYLHMPGAPNATHYPPGYPLLLAALWKAWPAFPQNVTLFKFANAALLGVATLLAWRFAVGRARLAPAAATLAVGLFTACAPVVLLGVMVLSEPLFMATLFPALLAAERAVATGRTRDALVAGVAGGLLSMVRTLGLLVVPATVLALAWRRRWRPAGSALAAGVATVLPWQVWVATHAHEVPPVFLGKYGSYSAWLLDAVRGEGLPWVARVAWFNLGQLAQEAATHTATALAPGWVRLCVALAVCGLIARGLRAAFPRIPASALFVSLYLAVVVAWPFAPARFLWGIWPLLGIVLALGARDLLSAVPHARSRAGARAARLATVTLVALLTAGYLRFNYQSAADGWWTRVQGSVADRARPLAEWVDARTRPDAVIASDDDVLIHLYTGRKVVPNGGFTPQEYLVPQTPDFAVHNLRTILETYRVDFVLASTEYGLYAVRGLLSAAPPELRIVTPLRMGGAFAPMPGGAE